MDNDNNRATFWGHLEDLRQAFIKVLIIICAGMVIPFYFQDSLIQWMVAPLHLAEPQAQLVLLSPVEGFMNALKVSFWVGLIGTMPLWIFPLIQFIAPGLRSSERRLLTPFLLGSCFFLGMGVALAYSVTLPMANRYFYEYNHAFGVNLWSLSSYLDFTMMLMLGHAVVFECGLILLFLVHYGFIQEEALRKKRRVFIVAAFILGALITPPDVPSQLMVAIPLVGMFELSLIYARLRRANYYAKT